MSRRPERGYGWVGDRSPTGHAVAYNASRDEDGVWRIPLPGSNAEPTPRIPIGPRTWVYEDRDAALASAWRRYPSTRRAR